MNLPAYLRYALTVPFRSNPATRRLRSIFDLPVAELKANGITLLIFDADDTLTGYCDPFSERTLTYLKTLSHDFSLAVLSNADPERGKEVKAALAALPIRVEIGDKPATTEYTSLLRHCQTDAAQAAMIGDRAGMDLAGARAAGINERILVTPWSDIFVGSKPPKHYRFIRALEALGAPASRSR